MKSYLRFLSRNRLYTAIEVVGLSLALAFVITLSSYIISDMSINKVLKNTDSIYLCHRKDGPNCFDDIPDFYAKFPEIENSCLLVGCSPSKSIFQEITTASHGDNKADVNVMGASDTFLDFFTIPLSEGQPEDALKSKHNAIISENLANVLFPDGDALGKKINVFEKSPAGLFLKDEDCINFDFDVVVTGIFKSFSRTIFHEPDLIMRSDLILEKQDEIFHGSVRIGEYSFIRLSDGTDENALKENLNSEFLKVAKNYATDIDRSISLTPFDDIRKQNPESFSWSFTNLRNGKLFNIYLTMCIFITLVSLLGYIVLTIAFSRFRIKEIATRKLLGTSKRHIIGRCFAETFGLLAVSCIFAIILSIAFKKPASEILGAEINPLSLMAEYLMLAGIILIMAAIASTVPSFTLSSYSAINVIKGEARYHDKKTFSKIFIGFAGFLCIAALSICFGITRQTRHLINQPLGYQTDSIVCVSFFGSETNRFNDELKALSFIEDTGFYETLPFITARTIIGTYPVDHTEAHFICGEKGFFNILGIDIMEDFNVASTDPYDGKWYMCQSSYENGSQYLTEGNIKMYRPVPLSGIVRDFKIGSLKSDTQGLMTFINVSELPEMAIFGNIIAKVNIDEDNAKKAIDEFYRKKEFNGYEYRVFTLQEYVENEIQEELNMRKLMTGFSIACILMSIMTIIGLCSYHAKASEKDNAVRNVFGSSKIELVRTFALHFTTPIVISALLAIPLAWIIIGKWLEGYAIRTDNSPIIYIGALVLVMSITAITLVIQASHLLRTNPADALKKE